jgi:predicted AlkP superfamily pyrophosphatase or phosphodiesterase
MSIDMTNSENQTLSIVTFIDALGWEVLKGRSFMEKELPHRRPLRSTFGFSSACVPSILTGKQPQEHGHWSFFYKTQGPSPFRGLRWLRHLPRRITDRGRVRSQISKRLKKRLGFKGYFQLYNIPFKHIDRIDYCEKNDLFKPGGINQGDSIFDRLDDAGVDYHVSDWRSGEPENISSLLGAIEQESIRFAFLYMADMDALLHQVGKDSDRVDEKLEWYEHRLRELLDCAGRHYDEVRLFVCSDHGMATVHTHVDVMTEIESLPLRYGEDYLATYDSTMARFWFETPEAEAQVRQALSNIHHGRILSDDELEALGCAFAGDQYGELIFLVDPGTIILPSHMGTAPITGMHGYHPDHADSDAALLSNVPPLTDPRGIADVFHLMTAEAGA